MNSYLLEVLATNAFQGQHVLLNTTRDMIKMGFRPESVRSVAFFARPVLKGFYLTKVPPTRGEIPGQQAIMQAYFRHPALFSLRHHPVIGEVREGKYAGERIALFTQAEIRDYFSLDAVRKAVKCNIPYRKTRWWVASSHAEAQPYYCRPDREKILNTLRVEEVMYDK